MARKRKRSMVDDKQAPPPPRQLCPHCVVGSGNYAGHTGRCATVLRRGTNRAAVSAVAIQSGMAAARGVKTVVARKPEWDIPAAIAKPTFAEVHAALDAADIPVNLTRKNVKTSENQTVEGMCLGLVNARSAGVVASSFCRARPNLTKTLVNFAKRHLPDFRFTSIQVNKNYLSAMHVDRNNLGPSAIVGVGDYSDGALWVQNLGAVDVKHKWAQFDGNVPHCTLPFRKGTRYTLIFFSDQNYQQLGALKPNGDDKAVIADLGFPMPPDGMRKLLYEKQDVRLQKAQAAFKRCDSGSVPAAASAAG